MTQDAYNFAYLDEQTKRMIRRAHHRTKSGDNKTLCSGCLLPCIKKPVANTVAPVVR